MNLRYLGHFNEKNSHQSVHKNVFIRGGTLMNRYVQGRPSLRLQNHDYSRDGAYFITIKVDEIRAAIFGSPVLCEIAERKAILTRYGEIVMNTWNDLPNSVTDIELDAFVIMPDHIHCIIVIKNYSVITGQRSPNTACRKNYQNITVGSVDWELFRKARRIMTLPKVIGRFKMVSAKKINELRNSPGERVWQRNYYEHVIRDENELCKIRRYIINNPRMWRPVPRSGNS
jgi:putative transposase